MMILIVRHASLCIEVFHIESDEERDARLDKIEGNVAMTQIYFRKLPGTQEEYDIAQSYFNVVTQRTNLQRNNGELVICRYSALPYNNEVNTDLHNLGLIPINSSIEHSYIAEMDWIYDLTEFTFPTWFSLVEVKDSVFPIVVKGRTNSRKFEWNSKMFAQNRAQAIEITGELINDPLIGPQGIVYRKFIQLDTFDIGLNDLPITNEWRCFYYKGQLIDYGFYWPLLDDLSQIDDEDFNKSGLNFANSIAQILNGFTNFYVIDVAKDVNNNWWVVEVNDGQMSGLATIPPERFYANLKRVLYDG